MGHTQGQPDLLLDACVARLLRGASELTACIQQLARRRRREWHERHSRHLVVILNVIRRREWHERHGGLLVVILNVILNVIRRRRQLLNVIRRRRQRHDAVAIVVIVKFAIGTGRVCRALGFRR